MTRSIIMLVVLAACASGARTRAPCEPVPEAFMAGEVYRDCAVDERARVSSAPRPDFSSVRPTGSSGCASVEIDVVVDARGTPIMSTAKLVRTNNQPFADAVLAALAGTRYRPAQKNGQAVAQLVRHEQKLKYMVSTSPTRAAGRAPPC